MRDRKKYASQSAPNRKHTTKDHATKVEPPTTTVAGTLDETPASSQAAAIPTTTLHRNKRPPLSKFPKKSKTNGKGRIGASSMVTRATPFTNARLARDSSRGRMQRPLKLPLRPTQSR